MTAMVADETPKKKTRKKAPPEQLRAAVDAGVEAAEAVLDGEPIAGVLKLADAPKSSKPKPKPGQKGFDWQTEYPGEQVYVYTAPSGTTIGLTRLGPHRKPKPGLLRRLHREEGKMSVLWYFVELASSPASLTVQEQLEEDEYADMVKGWADFAGIELNP
jgi:hypothetical protein